jgi:hypothetical protein
MVVYTVIGGNESLGLDLNVPFFVLCIHLRIAF